MLTLILLRRNEGGNCSPEGGFSPDLGTWPVQSTRSIPLFLQQAARPLVGAGSQLDRLPMDTAGVKPAADSRARVVRGIAGPATNGGTRPMGVCRPSRVSALAHSALRAYVPAAPGGAPEGRDGRGGPGSAVAARVRRATRRHRSAAEERPVTTDVAAWLRGLGLGQYEAAFRDNGVDASVLPELTAEDLKEPLPRIAKGEQRIFSLL